MTLTSQLTPLDQAKRLKELGVAQCAYFSWYVATDRDDDPALNRADFHCSTCGHPYSPYFEQISAFSVAELGVMLPLGYHTKTRDFDHADWMGYDADDEWLTGPHYNECQARAAMLIHLLQSDLVTADEVNKRLMA